MEHILKILIDKNLSIREISKTTGKSYSTIRYWLKKYNLTTEYKYKIKNKNNLTKICSECKDVLEIEKFYVRNKNGTPMSICKNCHNSKVKLRRNLNKLSSEEKNNNISNGLKLYYKNNPDKHPWKKNSKFKSVPCENFKNILTELNINFIEEFSISEERHYSIDIALPQHKIAIEVNGNQHYNKDGTLTEYYQIRHDFIKSCDYIVHELHYSLFFDRNNMIRLAKSILTNLDLFDFDYDQYLLNKLNKKKKKINYKKYNKCGCGDNMSIGAKCCLKCHSINRRTVERPNIKQLLTEVYENGYTKTGKKYNVSRTTIKKWLK